MKFKNIMLSERSQTWKSAVFWFHLYEDQTSRTGDQQLPVMDLKRTQRRSLGFWHVLYLFLRLFIYLIFFWLHWVFIAASRLSLVVVSVGGYSLAEVYYGLLICGGFCRCRAWALGMLASLVAARGLYITGLVVVVHRLSCPVVCGIFPDQGSNPCPHWQADS